MPSSLYETLKQEYIGKTKKSAAHYEAARRVIPGGESRILVTYAPYAITVTHGAGGKVFDLDGNAYVDYINNYMSLIHGHAFRPISDALKAQLDKGTVYAAPTLPQYDLAKYLTDHIPALEQIKFCNSGTEAVMYAIRAARACNRKKYVIRIDGGYNGTSDFSTVNMAIDMRRASGDLPARVLEPGVPEELAQLVIPVAFNDSAQMETVLKRHAGEVSAIVMEPMLGSAGFILPKPGYLRAVRNLADQYGALLIFDEVVSYRLSEGGLAALEGVEPDLMTLGKIIGGGLPIGAYGGRADIMKCFLPAHSAMLSASGTFSGNPMSMTAGAVALHHYPQPEIDRLNRLGDRLRGGLRQAAEKAGIPVVFTGGGSFIGYHFTRKKQVENATDSMRTLARHMSIYDCVHMAALVKGYYLMKKGRFILSTPMDEALVDKTTADFAEIFALIKPLCDALPDEED
ncbi:MAG: aminotransferase class III-fold pyridoxal phosphate-dependent enzyme [Zoogloeaceae bacterium]|nr:aminotransferase class III-fold pyridoxal phosphate-dependent enzyme [Zoogloeaceae bacterium]